MNLGSASINIFDAANLHGEQHTVTVGKDPMGFGFSADGKTVLVANHGDGSVSVVDLTTKKEIEPIPGGNRHRDTYLLLVRQREEDRRLSTLSDLLASNNLTIASRRTRSA